MLENTSIINCPQCSNSEDFTVQYHTSNVEMPVVNVMCNRCGDIFPVMEYMLPPDLIRDN